MSSLKPIHLYSHGATPNPVKVGILLEELGLPYIVTQLPGEKELKGEPYTLLNPNGRVPAIEDPNTGVKLWESGAIIEYLIDTYDTEKKFQYETAQEKWITKTWLYFQVSGQGPYFGQASWFKMFHPEKNITSAIERYQNEIKRVSFVIDAHLKRTGNRYLVGDKVTYADLAFISWNNIALAYLVPDWDYAKDYPAFAAWHKDLAARESVSKVKAKPEFQRH